MPADARLSSLAALTADILGRFSEVERILVTFKYDDREDVSVATVLTGADRGPVSRPDIADDRHVLMLERSASLVLQDLLYETEEDVDVRFEATRENFIVGLTDINSCCTKQIVWPAGRVLRFEAGIQRYAVEGSVPGSVSGHELMSLAVVTTLEELRRHPLAEIALTNVRNLFFDEDLLDEIDALDGSLRASARLQDSDRRFQLLTMHIAAPKGTELVRLKSALSNKRS